MFISVWINIRVFDLAALIHMSVFMTIPNCLDYYSSIVELEVRDGYVSGSFFIVWIILANLGFCLFDMKLSIVLSRSGKNCAGIFMRIIWNL